MNNISYFILSLQDGDVEEFRLTLRMSPHTYAKLLTILRQPLQKKYTNFRDPIDPEARLAVCMRYIALGDGIRSIAQQFRIGKSTAREIIRETCQVIFNVLKSRYMNTPNNRNEWLNISTEFQRKWNFPHCIGAVDGKHIRIAQPPNSGSFFFNYKGYYSVVLLGIVDASYCFRYVDVGSEGRASDGGIYHQSTFNQCISDPTNPLGIPCPDEVTPLRNIPYFLVGDDAFKLGPNMMKPFKGHNLKQKEEIFNYRLSRARRVAENAFGLLTCRFRVFRRTIEVHPPFVEDIVLACCALHNFLNYEGKSEYMPYRSVDQEMPNGDVIPGTWRNEAELDHLRRHKQKNPSQYAKGIRNDLTNCFLRPRAKLRF